jgi:hypothetical protein
LNSVCQTDARKILERVGRLTGRDPKARPFVTITVSKARRAELTWSWNVAKFKAALARDGAYLLQSNQPGWSIQAVCLDFTRIDDANVAVGPPLDLLIYGPDELRITLQRRFIDKAPDLLAIQTQWEQSLRKAVQELPRVCFDEPRTRS